MYVNPIDKQESLYFRFVLLTAVVVLLIMNGDIKGWHTLTRSVTTVRTVARGDCGTHAVAQLVEALCYKSKGGGFDSP